MNVLSLPGYSRVRLGLVWLLFFYHLCEVAS